MSKISIDIIMYLFEALFIFYYAQLLFKAKYKFYVSLIFCFLVHAALLMIYQFNITYLNAILVVGLNIIIFKSLYDISMKTAVFHSVITATVLLTSEILTMSISSILYDDFNALENNIDAYLFVVSTSKIIYFSIMLLIAKLCPNRNINSKKDKYFWMLFSIPFTSTLNFVVFRYITYQIKLTSFMSKMWIISCILTLFANVLVFVIYEISIQNTIELYELKTINQKQEQDKQYFEILEETNNDMRILTHNIKNHLIQIRNLNDADEMKEYIDTLYPDIEQFSQIGISQNKMLDLILSKYQKLCNKKNIEFDIDVKTSNLKFIDDFDLSTLLNNLLDNAVEATDLSAKKRISFMAFEKNNRCSGIIIKNSCDIPPKSQNGILQTTKSNKELHGIGMLSVNKILKKYNGVLDWAYDEAEHIFYMQIAFMNK